MGYVSFLEGIYTKRQLATRMMKICNNCAFSSIKSPRHLRNLYEFGRSKVFPLSSLLCKVAWKLDPVRRNGEISPDNAHWMLFFGGWRLKSTLGGYGMMLFNPQKIVLACGMVQDFLGRLVLADLVGKIHYNISMFIMPSLSSAE